MAWALAVGCSSKPPSAMNSRPPRITLPRASTSASAPAAGAMPSLLLGRMGAGSHGPYLATSGDHALALVVAPGGGGLVWSVRPLNLRGESAGAVQELGPAPADVSLLSLRPGPGDGFFLVSSRKVESGHVIEVRGLDASGAPRGKPATVYQGADAPAWVDAVPAAAGGHVYFTVTSPAGGRVHALEVSAAGEAKGATGVVMEGASSWHVVPTAKGSLLLAVGAAGQGPRAGQMVAVPVGEGGRPGAVEVIQKEAGVGAELDAVAIGDRVFVGWDERGPLDLRVKIAALSAEGKTVAAPRAVLRSAGDQALIGLSAGREGGLLVAWDDLALGRDDGRWVRLSALPGDLGAPLSEGALRYGMNDGSVPLVQAASWGYGALTLARACKGNDPCAQMPLWPTFVRLDTAMNPQAQAPILLDSGAPPESAWSLVCGQPGCAALALDGASSALAMRLEAEGDGGWAPAARRMTIADAPAPTTMESLWKGPRIADVALASMGEGWLAATVTDHAEGSAPPPLPADVDKRAEADKDRALQRSSKAVAPRSGIVTVHALSDTSSAAHTLSVRALSSPGVSIAASAQGKDACVAWVARDNGDPEVFLTRVDHEGKRVGQQTLTRSKGDVLDVTVAAVDDGWIVVWVDARDGNGEVYAARVDGSLRRKGAEQRITNAPGDASDLSLLVRGKTAIVAFSDSRGSPKDGVGDVYVARLRADDATKIADETRVAATPEHGRATQLQPLGDEVLLSWLEQAAPSEVSKGAQIHLSILDRDGALRSLPEALPLGKPGPLSSLGVQCQGDRCRFVVGRPEGRQLWLSAFSWRRGQREVTLGDVAPLFAGAAADVTPALGPSWVMVGDDASSGDEGRLRRLGVRWP